MVEGWTWAWFCSDWERQVRYWQDGQGPEWEASCFRLLKCKHQLIFTDGFTAIIERPGKFSEDHLVRFKPCVFSLYLLTSVRVPLQCLGGLCRPSCMYISWQSGCLQCHLKRVALGWGFISCVLFFILRYSYLSVFIYGINANEKKPPLFSIQRFEWMLAFNAVLSCLRMITVMLLISKRTFTHQKNQKSSLFFFFLPSYTVL